MRDRSSKKSERVKRRWGRMSSREKGIAVAITAASLTFVIPAAGLAVDASMLYGVRARLSASADAAALAAARSLSNGLTIGEQEASAINTAERFFHANFPDHYLNSTNITVGAQVAETGTRTRTVTVDAGVDAPSYFLRYLGKNSTHLRAVGKASRRDVNVMMVLDRSGSLALASPEACTPMKNAATAFAKKFANYRDRVGLLSFGGDDHVDFPMQATPGNFLTTANDNIPYWIGRINCVGGTNSAQALWHAYEQLKAINETGSLNVILFFTDGQPKALTFDFSAANTLADNALRTEARGYNGAAPTSTSGITDISRTPCSNLSNKIGWIDGSNDSSSSGRTTGLYKHNTDQFPPVTSSTPSIASSNRAGCVFNTDWGGDRMKGDFGFMPPTDIYGNSVTGYLALGTAISAGPDTGKTRIDNAQILVKAAKNAANDAARRIRTNATSATQLNTVIYSIGLGAVDAEFLNRVSNAKTSPAYDPAQPEGLYVYAPQPADLNEAFARIAGEILRIAR